MRRKYPKTKTSKKHFPLWQDRTYKSLSVEHQKFVYNIFLQPVTNWNNTQCYQDATTRTIKQSTAYTYASELLKNPKIKHCIEKVKKHYRRQLRITPERLLKEEAAIALSDIVEFFDDNGYLIEKPSKLPAHVRRAISGFRRVQINGVDRYEVTLWNKGDALKRLHAINGTNAAKQYNIAGTVAVDATINTHIDLSELTDDELRQLKTIQSKIGLNKKKGE